MAKEYSFTRKQLKQAFKEWNQEYLDNPEKYEDTIVSNGEAETTAERQTAFLLSKLNKTK